MQLIGHKRCNVIVTYRVFTRSSKHPAGSAIITYSTKRLTNFQQTSSISTCILNTFAGSLLDVCWIV